MLMINISDVTKHYDRKMVLNHVSIRFEQEKTHVLLGSSGSGKSTLLRLIMGLIPFTEGSISINGEMMNISNQQQLVRKMGYVIQDGGLFPHLTVRNNVTLSARTLGWDKEKIRTRLEDLLSLVEFDPLLLNKFPQHLSGGQKQRVGLMRALFLNPEILLLDEPLGALDPIVRASLQSQLKDIFNRLKKTVVIVTHDIGEAAFFGHTITLMSEGRIVQHGTFQDLVSHPKDPFVTEFINAQRPPPELGALL
jgi:osmoprotectant transport system ATP-binding protein